MGKSKADIRNFSKEDYPLLFSEEKHKQENLRQRYEEALSVAKEAAALLKREYGAENVWIFGSLTDFDHFNKWSDVDLAVQGVPDERFYAAVTAVTDLVTDFEVDLIDIDDCKESLKKAVEHKGIKL